MYPNLLHFLTQIAVIKTALSCLLLLLTSHSAVASSSTQKPLIVSAYSTAIREYQHYIQSRDPLTISNFSMSTHITRRVILEMLLLQQALNRGGIKQPIRFKASANDNYHYMLNQIITGKALAYSDSFWMADLKPEAHNFYVSPATIEYGQYIVGLYTSSTNKRALASNSAKLHTLSAVSNRAWSADWIALESLQLKELRHSRHWRLMASMVQKHDIDFLLNPFQGTADQTMSRGNFNLIPIPGLKLALYDSRHFAISRYHPQGQRMYQALKLGINKLKQDGTWIRAYREAGVIDPRVDQWTTVNPPIKSEKK